MFIDSDSDYKMFIDSDSDCYVTSRNTHLDTQTNKGIQPKDVHFNDPVYTDSENTYKDP